MDSQSRTICLWAEAEEDFSTTAAETNRKGGEVRRKRRGQTKVIFSLSLYYHLESCAMGNYQAVLITLGLVAGRVLQFIIKSWKACAGSQLD